MAKKLKDDSGEPKYYEGFGWEADINDDYNITENPVSFEYIDRPETEKDLTFEDWQKLHPE